MKNIFGFVEMFLLSLIYQTRRKAQNHNQMSNIKLQIENKLKTQVKLIESNDGANLQFEAIANDGTVLAKIYKSFDKNFNKIQVVKYTWDAVENY
jgi:hypothetical protein